MTKRFLVFLIGFVFLGLIVYAQIPEENFQKAGKAELAKTEAVLLQKKAEIEKFFDGMANDAVISGKEMKTLKEMVKDFDKTQKQFNKELKFYGIKTAAEIFSTIREHLNIYHGTSKKGNEDLLNHADNSKQDIRRFFTQKTGCDIRVEKSRDHLIRFLCGFLVGYGVVLLVYLVAGVKDSWVWYLTSITFILILLAFLFWF